MAIELAALGFLAFLLGCTGIVAEPQNQAAKSSLIGTWKNDCNASMEINSVSKTGVFSGVYKMAVSASDKPIPPSPLVGVQQQGRQPVFGFTVKWVFNESTTVFVGQYIMNKNGKAQLKATWLQRQNVGSAEEDWGATWVGTSTFYRSN